MSDSKHEGNKLANWLKRSPPKASEERGNLKTVATSEKKEQLNLKISESEFLEYEELRRLGQTGPRPISKLELFRRMMALYRDRHATETE